jgi:hypothetical protein
MDAERNMGKILIKLNHTKTIGIKKSIVSIVLMT